ncbi:beta-ketoacyl synthase N-terminal-like domain-containing protein [Alkalimonas collagenimarina]|uniref:Beta-ketoacyl synthase N-terminal-like domain-containing protein n=1 Tax=Alkalimonas collagenimarina TaxID=400390 RepID=A0ABT9GWX2_9GAMM|nr:polyketide synthase [Alkalimonas collagenimarina]MDP4535566.1 beta-ketoacyl synthase N-terminal-like domain-containing protein [Alkalimonas collagenimarina]
MMATDDIAIVGLACRFPEASSPTQFWQNLAQGRESIARLSDAQLRHAGVSDSEFEQPSYVKAYTPLADVDKFDARFFGVPTAEAKLMDPQQRTLLEIVYHALEDAGALQTAQQSETGVYATGGGITRSYLYQEATKHFNGNSDTGSLLQLLNDKDFLATRVSYKLNLQGPSLSVQTACSSSMVAVHLARSALLSGEIDIGIAAASCIRLPQDRGYNAAESMIYSPTGRCRTFSDDADGTIFGSGSGAVVLKRYQDALADGDHIYALLKSTAVNNDGAGKFGFTASSVPGQAKAIVKAIALAGISADQLSYIECHGTATKIGDPLEIRSLEKAFSLDTDKKQFCHIGSVKPNIGHLEQAAGLASLIKLALMIKHRRLVPTINFRAPNPKLKLPQSPFKMALDYEAWEPEQQRRYAGLNCLGVGGTNVFAVLSDLPTTDTTLSNDNSFVEPAQDVLCLSAKTKAQLVEYIECIANDERPLPLCALAYNINTSRAHLPIRNTVVINRDMSIAQWREQALTKISAPSEQRRMTFDKPAHYICNPTEFVNPSQLAALTTDMRCQHFTDTHQRWLDSEALTLIIASTAPFAQHVAQLFAFELALYEQLKHWGMKMASFLGEGIGQYVQLLLAGVPLQKWLNTLEKELHTHQRHLSHTQTDCFSQMGEVAIEQEVHLASEAPIIYRNRPSDNTTESVCVCDSGRFTATDLWSLLATIVDQGAHINWQNYYPFNAFEKHTLPNYPFEKKRYWLVDED